MPSYVKETPNKLTDKTEKSCLDQKAHSAKQQKDKTLFAPLKQSANRRSYENT